MSLIPDQLYVTLLGVITYAILYIPVSVVLLVIVYTLFKKIIHSKILCGIYWCIGFLILLAPMMEVYYISIKAKHICNLNIETNFYADMSDSDLMNVIRANDDLVFEVGEINSDTGTMGVFLKDRGGNRLATNIIYNNPHRKIIGRYFSIAQHEFYENGIDQKLLARVNILHIYPAHIDWASGLIGPVTWRCGNMDVDGRPLYGTGLLNKLFDIRTE